MRREPEATSHLLPPGHRLRVASFEEMPSRTAYAVWALRSQVFVVEQECAYQDLDGRDLEPGTRHLWVEAQDGPVAYLRVLEDGSHVRVSRVVTHSRARGRGLAAALVTAAIDLAPGRDVVLDAQSHLAGWYRRLGFVRDGEEFVEDGIPHLPMRLLPSADGSR